MSESVSCTWFVDVSASDSDDVVYRGNQTVMLQCSGNNLHVVVDLCSDSKSSDLYPQKVAVATDAIVVLDPEEESWSCVRCTYLNHPAMNICECCSLPRAAESAEGEFLTVLCILCLWCCSHLTNGAGLIIICLTFCLFFWMKSRH